MLEFGNKEFRNLQEQVGKNQEDIKTLKSGIIVEYWVSTVDRLSDLMTEENVGKFVVVSEPTKKLYLITKRANGGLIALSMGDYPAVVTGEQGPQGEPGENGERGNGIYGCSSYLPSASAYKDGDMYLLFNGELYKKVLGNWKLQTSLKGPQGPIGDSGDLEVIANPVGEAQDAITKIKIAGVTYDIGIGPEYKTYLDLLREYVEIDSTTGKATFGNDVEVDGKLQVNEYSDFIDAEGHVIGMSAEEKNRLAKSLVIPTPTISAIELVGIDTTKSQARISIGNGLLVENGTLSATGGETPTNMVTTDTEQTITGKKNFPNGIQVKTREDYKWEIYSAGAGAILGFGFRTTADAMQPRYGMASAYFSPLTNNLSDLGGSGSKWKNFYISGKISDGTNEVTVAQLANAGGTKLYKFKFLNFYECIMTSSQTTYEDAIDFGKHFISGFIERDIISGYGGNIGLKYNVSAYVMGIVSDSMGGGPISFPLTGTVEEI